MFCNDALNWNTHTDRFITIFQIFTKWQLQTFVMPIHLQHHQQEENFKFCNLLQNYLITDMLLVKWNHETLMNISKNLQTLNFGQNPSKKNWGTIELFTSAVYAGKIKSWNEEDTNVSYFVLWWMRNFFLWFTYIFVRISTS